MKMKMKKFFILLIAAAIAFQPVFVTADIGSAVAYLQTQPQDAWVTQALAAVGADNIATGHLDSVSGTSATDYAKAILALAAVGKNPATFGNIDYAAKLKTYYNNNQIGNEGLLNDDMWSVLALASAGEKNSEEAVGAKNYLLSHQNIDGGWGYAVSGGSDTNDTAAAIMALVEAGLNPADQAIINAVNYLKSAQNNDGGFGYMPGSESDSGSDSWIISAIYKIKQNPNDWNKNGGNPIAHLQTLQDTDGGFWWVKPGTSKWNNKAMTAYAVIALTGKSFPVGYYNKANAGKYHIRIEGGANTICDTYADGKTALDVMKNAAESCDYTCVIQDTSYGPYLSKINNEEAAGMSGWMYFVNYKSPPIGAADYLLAEGDEVLWYYGDWGWQPTRMLADEYSLETGRSIAITVEYFNGQSWLALEGATVKGAEQNYTTSALGRVIAVLPDGYYVLYAQKDGFVRSNQKEISVGAAVSRSVGLTVEIEQPGSSDGVGVAGEAIIFEVTPSQLSFGKIKPGGTASQTLNISNLGTVNLIVAAVMAGNSVFKENLQLDNRLWPNYSAVLASDESKDVKASLPVPANYLDSGIKTGELILWARIQE
ncbi:MAG: DUF4430 domain-containing protein [Candidatus Methanoperedens sp.]|nr:DUF4430 domain-containing protein [Candidatus Methanoperedens sp.]